MSGKKKIIIGSSVAAAVVAALVITLIAVFNKEEAYRVIKVMEIDGTAVVDRENVGELQAYSGMTLQSGDKLSVASNSMLVLQMDDDKYAYVEQDTILTMVAEGTSRDSKTVIELERGAITSHVENKLNDSSSYEVHTQNSVMAVRGTVYRVNICEPAQLGNDGGEPIVQLSVWDGEVLATLIHPNGETGAEKTVSAGQSAAVGSDASGSFFLSDADLSKLPIPEEDMQVLKALQDIIEREDNLSVTKEKLAEMVEILENEGICDVYFYADGKLFGVQQVQFGECPQKPGLSPSDSGAWNIDFDKPVTGITEVYWIE
ncbi:MAG: FecR domain-containing protein [Lachnospiraceae bacterium]|nr:FecR domain-containing protein [Lachnospiraceae bacterium]